MEARTRENAITTLKRIRSKAIDTERLLLRDTMTAQQLVNRAAEIEGQAHILAGIAFEMPNSISGGEFHGPSYDDAA